VRQKSLLRYCLDMKFLLALSLLAALLPSSTVYAAAHPKAAAPAATGKEANSKELHDDQDWRTERARKLSAPDGWLTLVGLEWLKPGSNSIGLAADNQIRLTGHAPDHLGTIEVEGATVRFVAPAGGFPKFLFVDGQPAQEGPLRTDDDHKPSLLST
jgi:uncharacterized protein